MSRDVPSGWSQTTLGALMSFQNGFAFKPEDWSSSGTPIVRIQNLNGSDEFNHYTGSIPERFHVRSGDVLFCWSGSRGTSFGPRKWQGGVAFLNQHIFRCDFHDGTHSDFGYHLLHWLTKEIEQEAHGGAGLVHIKKSELVKIASCLPPLTEQRRIAEILSSVDEAIQATEAVIEQTRKVKDGVLERLLTKGIGHTEFKDTEIGRIPKSWNVEPVEAGFEVLLGKMLSQKARAGKNAKPYLRNANVLWGHFRLDDILRMDFDSAEQSRFAVKKGDLLVCEGGEVGRCAIWNRDDEVYYQKALHRVRPKDGDHDNRMLQYLLFHIFTQSSRAAGLIGQNSIPHFTLERFRSLLIPRIPLKEQHEILNRLDALSDAETPIRASLDGLRTMKSALMSDLLTGRKRVTDAMALAAE